SIEVTNTPASSSNPLLWIDANGNLTTTAGNVFAGARGHQDRDSAQHLLYLTDNGTVTTAVTNKPKISVTNDKFDDLLYRNAFGNLTIDAGNKQAITSAATAAQLASVNHGLTTVSIWVEDDN